MEQEPASASNAVEAAIEKAAAEVGADVFAHGIDIDTGVEVAYKADDLVVSASTFKVPILTEYVRQVWSGELDATKRIRIAPGTGPYGPTGLSLFTEETEWSLRDLATSMIVVSDNAATDIVLDLVGRERVNATMVELGVPETVLVGDCMDLLATIAADYGVTNDDASVNAAMKAGADRVSQLTINTPELTNRTTPRAATTLLRALWTDAAAKPEACAEARRILGMQFREDRIPSGFPGDGPKISGKSGTVGIVRNEIGVIEYPSGHRYAVGIFLRHHKFVGRNPHGNRLVGTVARILVDYLGEVQA